MPTSNSPLTVLIVDDDAGMRSSLRRILKLDGYAIDEATSVAELFVDRDWGRYFAMLVDRRLPDGTADEILPKLSSVAPDAAIVVVTGNADLDGSIAAIRNGASDYLLKPVEPTALQARLRSLAELWKNRVAVERRDAQLAFMVENLPAAAAYVDRQTQKVRFNSVIEDLTGYDASELTTVDNCFERLFPTTSTIARRVYERNRATWADEALPLEITHRDGSIRTLEFRGYRYNDHEVWMLQDVTERLQHETELRIRDRAIQSANEGIVIADATQPGTPIVFVNEAFQKISGLAFDDAIGSSCDILCGTDPDAETLTSLKTAIDSGSEFRRTIQCSCKQGNRYWSDLSVAPVRNPDGQISHIVAIVEDVSERRDAQQQLLQSERLAAIGQMVTGLAHESRNALQRAQACLDMLTLDLEDQPEQLELTEKTRRALSDLYRYYEEVRNYAAPINLERRDVSMTSLIWRVWNNLETVRAGRDARLEVTGCDGELICSVDDHRFEQVVRNILENSLAACEDPAVLEVECSSQSHEGENVARLAFRDNGPGFDAETAASAFQPFFTTKQKGTGLGMAISRRIVEAHGGQISVIERTNGAEVAIEIPVDSHS